MYKTEIALSLISTSIVLITAFVCVTTLVIKLQQRKRAELHRLNIWAEVMGQEKDRAHISYKLHEEFGATLSVVKMGMNSFDLSSAEDKAQLEKNNRYLDDVITKIRSIAADFLPYTLQKKQLVRTLEWFVHSTNESNDDITITFKDSDDIPEISEHKTLHLYRIIQEIVHNTIKHAHATVLLITLTKEQNKLQLVTKDNGVGFDYEKELKKEKGLGLNNMLNRISLLKGTINALSETKKGTTYMIEVPLSE